MIECPVCKTQVEVGTAVCPRCGASLVGVAETRALGNTDYEPGTPRWGTARFDSRMNLVIRARDSGDEFTFDAKSITELTLGRLNPDTGEAPPVDLHAANGIEQGVSRRHAAIVRREGGALSLVDLGSDNGTYLNGQRLIPNQPRILRDGDEVRLGYLVLNIKFESLT